MAGTLRRTNAGARSGRRSRARSQRGREPALAPGSIDGPYHAEGADEGIVLRQYLCGTARMDGMGGLVTTLSWEGGQPVALDRRSEWYY